MQNAASLQLQIANKLIGRKYTVFLQSLRKQLSSIFNISESNYAVIDFTAQVWEIITRTSLNIWKQ